MPFRGANPPPGVVVVAASDTPAAKRRGAQYRCDGAADQVEIQAAIDSIPDGGRVLLLEGTYNLTATVNLVEDLILEGEGRATILNQGTDTPTLRALNVAGVVVRELQIDGPGTGGAGGHGIQLDGVTDGRVEGVELVDVVNAVHLTGASTRCRVERSRIWSCFVGVMIDDAAVESLVESNEIGRPGAAPSNRGVDCSGPRTRIVNNRFGPAVGQAINLPGSDSAVVGNYVRGNGAVAPSKPSTAIVASGDRIVVANNTVIECLTGIRGSGAHVVVVGNLVDLSRSTGLNVDGTFGLYAGNLILRSGQNQDNVDDAVQVLGSNNALTGNMVKHAGAAIQARDGVDIIAGANTNFVDGNDLRASGRTNSLVNSGTGTVTVNNQI